MLPYLLQKRNQKAKLNLLKSWRGLFRFIRNLVLLCYPCHSPIIVNEVYNKSAGGHSFVYSFSFTQKPYNHLQHLNTYSRDNGIFRQISAYLPRGPPDRP